MSKRFKNKYPRLFNKIINQYKYNKIYDFTAAILMFLRKEPPPKCEVCDSYVTISKKFRNTGNIIRCNKHTNTNNIVTVGDLLLKNNDLYSVISYPAKALTNTDIITVECKFHGQYNVKIGNFLNGMKCQKCYFNSMIGKPGVIHSSDTKKKISIARRGKTMHLSTESKNSKTEKQKQSWNRRKKNVEEFNKYTSALSERRKKYLKEHGHRYPPKSKTGLEINFEKFLISHNLDYTFQYFFEGKKFDFFIPSLNLIVEVDGEYWHNFPSSIKNDIEKHKICKSNNIQLVRISSDNFYPEIIFKNITDQNDHNKHIYQKRGINGF